MASLWCLYDKKRSTFHTALTYGEARAIVRVLGLEERLSWYVWKESWPQWKILTQVAELVATTTEIKPMRDPPSLPAAAESSEIAEHISEEKDARKINRTLGELTVEIICRGRKFYSVTRDISLKGVQLKDSVPDWMAGYCTLILSRPKNESENEPSDDQNLEFTCSIVENQELGKKFRLEIQPSKDSLHLKRWLLDLHLRNIKKSTA
ncbi:MAG: PilZ domain-containing protein [Pseudomonadota bacterium]|nr:PilZ domain-containing protein [Pseudomonadota bacterium]